MDFKKLVLTTLAGGALMLSLSACTVGPANDDAGEGLVGSPLKTVSGLTKSDGDDKSEVVVFDETTRQIYQFDLAHMTYEKTLQVSTPAQKHYLLYQDQGNYVVDVFLKSVSIFDRAGLRHDDVLHFTGNPKSGAYQADLNLLVIYDDLNSVGIVKLDASGNVLQHFVGGSLIGGSASISSGDLLADGRLVLALTDNSIAVIDTMQSLTQQRWVFTTPLTPTFSTTLTNIQWVAPVNDNNQEVFVRAQDTLALIDLSSKSIVATKDISGYVVEKYSKVFDAHAVLRSGTELTMAYPQGGQIKTRDLMNQKSTVMSSYLNLQKDTWTYVDTLATYSDAWNDLNAVKVSRTLKRYRLSDMLGLDQKPAPDQAQLELSASFMFALYPSELGYAQSYSIDSDQVKEVKLFNMHR